MRSLGQEIVKFPRSRALRAPLLSLSILTLALAAVAGACGGGKANPPPSSDRPGSGGRPSTGTGGSRGTGGALGTVGTGGATAAGGATGMTGTGGATTTPDAADVATPVDTGADLEPVDLGPPPVTCGNGSVDPGEDCDKGAGNESNPYGKDKCSKNCKWAPYCGDSAENKGNGEECDKGAANADKAYGAKGDCSAMCKLVPHCGDSKVQEPAGEKCDEGADKNPAAGKAGCKSCQIVPALSVCGDGKKEGDEACDNGNANIQGDYSPKPAAGNAVLCSKECKLITKFCGDNKTDNGHEQCDKGPAGEAAAPGKPGCSNECRTTNIAASCGDGLVNVTGEECDQGAKNRGSDGLYAGTDKPSPYLDPATGKPALLCSRSCKNVHYCGDQTVQPVEECDLGPGNDANAYGEGKCTDRCARAPSCGDNKVSNAEKCDNGGANLDPATSYVAGPVNLDKPPCRRGVCTVIPHCGDGTQTNDEKCDNGKNNVASDYVGGAQPSGAKPPCKASACTLVPYCGDGVVSNSESCDPQSADSKLKKDCTNDCKKGPVARDLAVNSVSNTKCPGNNDGCAAKLNGGQEINVSCKDLGNTVMVFPALDGAVVNDDVTLELTGGAAQVVLKCGNTTIPGTGNRKLPKACWDNGQEIRITVENPATAGCLSLSKARVKTTLVPN